MNMVVMVDKSSFLAPLVIYTILYIFTLPLNTEPLFPPREVEIKETKKGWMVFFLQPVVSYGSGTSWSPLPLLWYKKYIFKLLWALRNLYLYPVEAAALARLLALTRYLEDALHSPRGEHASYEV
jgi:hypothetical protein